MLLSMFENILVQNYNDFLLCEDIIIKLQRKSHKYAKSLKCFLPNLQTVNEDKHLIPTKFRFQIRFVCSAMKN